MKKEEHINKILKENPQIKKENLISRSDGGVEWICEHGVGHTIWSETDHYEHGCDGCCRRIR